MDYLIKLIFVLLLSAGAYSQTVDRIAVIVNDGVVLESDIQLKIKNFKKEAAISGARVPSEKDLRDEIIEALIIEELQLQIADKAGIKISDEELNVTVKRVAQQNELTIEEFIQSIEDEGDSYELVRDEIKRSLKINRVQQGRVQNRISITQEELVNFKDYDKTIKYCHSTVGIAILNTSITIVFGFSILILSNFIPTIYFGIFTGIAMLLAMISVLTLLPSLLLVFKPFKIK